MTTWVRCLAVIGASLTLWARAEQPAGAEGLAFAVHEPAARAPHPPLIILLHGQGADETDMIGLWSQLPPDFVVVSPRAPQRNASGGYSWYHDRNSTADLDASRRDIDDLTDRVVKQFDADPSRVFVGGFSQGAVMTYQLTLLEPGRFRGGAVLSGAVTPSLEGRLPPRTDWSKVSLFIGHGTADNRIPYSAATTARATLAKLGVRIEFHAYAGMGHTVGDGETRDLNKWLQREGAIGPK